MKWYESDGGTIFLILAGFGVFFGLAGFTFFLATY